MITMGKKHRLTNEDMKCFNNEGHSFEEQNVAVEYEQQLDKPELYVSQHLKCSVCGRFFIAEGYLTLSEGYDVWKRRKR